MVRTAARLGFLIVSTTAPFVLGGCGDDDPVDGAASGASGSASSGGGGPSGSASSGSGSPCNETVTNADHCGACDQPCAEAELCLETTCVSGGGDGTSCESALFWDAEAEEQVGFKMWPALSTTHTFSCGPSNAVATRWFRFLAPKEDTSVEVRATTDDYILEVFSAASCDTSSLFGCNDNQAAGDVLPKVDIATVEGTAFYAAVGLLGTWSGAPAQVRVDH